jgi:hypothetical protein
MSIRFLHQRGAASAGERTHTDVTSLPTPRACGRACCCPGRPVVVAWMPSAGARPHRTDLLLCAHHYRVSREALRAAGARVVDMNGAPVSGDDMFCLGRAGEPAIPADHDLA